MEFQVSARCGAARRGTITLTHGVVETPVFMTSMFSAVFISRGLVALVYGGRKKLDKISIGQVWKPAPGAA